jgi:PAS domain S-box-containing protein
MKFGDETAFFEITSSPLKDSGEKILGAIEIVRDITERKRVEEKLIFLAKIQDQVKEMIITLTPERRVLTINQSALKILGHEERELLGRDISVIVPGDQIENAKGFWRKIKEEGHIEDYEGIRVTKLGRRIPLEFSGVFVRGVGKSKSYVIGVARDISERKEAELALKKSEEKFRMLSEKSPNMIFINKGGRIVYVNKRCEDLMGYTKKEFYSQGFDFMNLIAPQSRELVKENLKKHIEGEDFPPYEYTLITKGGREIIGIHNTKLIEYDGEPAILGIITDITERKLAEEELNKKIKELEKWQNLTIGRELKMVELKKELNDLKRQLREQRE